MNQYRIIYLIGELPKLIRVRAHSEAEAREVVESIVFRGTVEVIQVVDEGRLESYSASPSISPSSSISASLSASPSSAPVLDYSSLPHFDAFISKTLEWAHLHTNTVDHFEYDGGHCWYVISDLSGVDFTQAARHWISNHKSFWAPGFSVQGYRTYAAGYYDTYVREGYQQTDLDELRALRMNSSYSSPNTNDWLNPPDDVWAIFHYNMMREVAYGLLHYVYGEKAREIAGRQPVRETFGDVVTGEYYVRYTRLLDACVGHLHSADSLQYEVKPFMLALSSYALIMAYEHDPESVDSAISGVGRYVTILDLLTNVWYKLLDSIFYDDEGYLITLYKIVPDGATDINPNEENPNTGAPADATNVPVNDLNMIVAAPLAWLYKETSDPIFRDTFDDLMEGAIHRAYWNTPNHTQFFQQWMLTEKALEWRLMGGI